MYFCHLFSCLQKKKKNRRFSQSTGNHLNCLKAVMPRSTLFTMIMGILMLHLAVLQMYYITIIPVIWGTKPTLFNCCCCIKYNSENTLKTFQRFGGLSPNWETWREPLKQLHIPSYSWSYSADGTYKLLLADTVPLSNSSLKQILCLTIMITDTLGH